MATKMTVSSEQELKELRNRLDRLVAQWEETSDLISTVQIEASNLMDKLRQQLERAISPTQQTKQDDLPF